MKKNAAFSFSVMFLALCLVMSYYDQSFALPTNNPKPSLDVKYTIAPASTPQPGQGIKVFKKASTGGDTSKTVKKTIGLDVNQKYTISNTDLTRDTTVGSKITVKVQKKTGGANLNTTGTLGMKSETGFSQNNGAAGIITGSTAALAGIDGKADLNFISGNDGVGLDFLAAGFVGLQAAIKAGFTKNTGDLESNVNAKITGQVGAGGETEQNFYAGKDGVSGLFKVGAGAGPSIKVEADANTKFQGYDLDTVKAKVGFGGAGAGITVGASLRKDKIGGELGGFLGLKGTFGYYYNPEGYSKVLEKYVPGYKDLPDSAKLAGGAAVGLLPTIIPNGKVYSQTALSYLESQQSSGNGVMTSTKLKTDPHNTDVQYTVKPKSLTGVNPQIILIQKKSDEIPKKSNPEELAARIAASRAKPGTDRYNAIYSDYLKILTSSNKKPK